MQEKWVEFLDWGDPLEKELATHTGILAWKSHGQRTLVGYSPWGLKESYMTEVTYNTHTNTHISYWFYSGEP